MPATNKTTNYELPIFIGTDKPSWMGDWNGAMNKIDSVLGTIAGNVQTALTTANAASTTAEAAQTAVTGMESAITDMNEKITDLETLTQTQGQEIQDLQNQTSPFTMSVVTTLWRYMQGLVINTNNAQNVQFLLINSQEGNGFIIPGRGSNNNALINSMIRLNGQLSQIAVLSGNIFNLPANDSQTTIKVFKVGSITAYNFSTYWYASIPLCATYDSASNSTVLMARESTSTDSGTPYTSISQSEICFGIIKQEATETLTRALILP